MSFMFQDPDVHGTDARRKIAFDVATVCCPTGSREQTLEYLAAFGEAYFES